MSRTFFLGHLLVTFIIIMYLCTRINEHNERNDMDKQTVTKADQRTVPIPTATQMGKVYKRLIVE